MNNNMTPQDLKELMNEYGKVYYVESITHDNTILKRCSSGNTYKIEVHKGYIYVLNTSLGAVK